MGVLLICRVVERGVLEFIIPGGMNKWIILRDSRQDFLGFFVMYETEITRVNVVKDVRREGIKLCVFFMNRDFYQSDCTIQGGGVSIEKGRTSWYLDAPCIITFPPTWLPPICQGGGGRFWFAPLRHGTMKICLFYEGCGFW